MLSLRMLLVHCQRVELRRRARQWETANVWGPALILALSSIAGCSNTYDAGNRQLGPDATRDASTDGKESPQLADGGLPLLGVSTPGDCATPAQYRCSTEMAQTNSCFCDPGAPLAPADCVRSEQFRCAAYLPTPRSCECDADAPATEADCASGVLSCESDAPRFGCQCAALAEL